MSFTSNVFPMSGAAQDLGISEKCCEVWIPWWRCCRCWWVFWSCARDLRWDLRCFGNEALTVATQRASGRLAFKKKRLQHFSQSIFSIFFTSFAFHSLALGSLCHEALDGELGGLDSSPKAAPSSKAAALVDVQLPFATYSEHLETVGPTGRTCDCDQNFCDTRFKRYNG